MTRILALLLALASVLSIVTFLGVSLSRISYPFELEWMEGASADHVARIRSGKPLYGPPSLEFVAFIYPPLYVYVSAGASALLGAGLLPLRLVSLGATLGALALIARIVSRETGSRLAALAATGLYAASFGFCGFWFDVARADALLVLLLLCSLSLLRLRPTPAGAAASALMLSLAIFAKQTSLGLAPIFLVLSLMAGWRSGIAFALAAALGIPGAAVAVNRLYDGWFFYYCFRLPRGHRFNPEHLRHFWTIEFLPNLPVALAFALIAVSARTFRRDLRGAAFWALAGGGMVGMSWIAMLKLGGYRNNFMPACASLAILFGLGLHEALSVHERRGGRIGSLVAILALALASAQLGRLAYDPRRQVPSSADRAAGERILRTIRAIPGDVIVPMHGHLGPMAGRPMHAHAVGLHDLMRGDHGPVGKALHREVRDAIARGRFSAIIVDEAPWFPGELAEFYERKSDLFGDESVFWPVTGRMTRPETVYVPRRPPPMATVHSEP